MHLASALALGLVAAVIAVYILLKFQRGSRRDGSSGTPEDGSSTSLWANSGSSGDSGSHGGHHHHGHTDSGGHGGFDGGHGGDGGGGH